MLVIPQFNPRLQGWQVSFFISECQPLCLGGNTSFAYGINDMGQVVGDSPPTNNAASHAFIYSNGEIHDLGTLGGGLSGAQDINNIGQIVGYSRILLSSTVEHAFLYTNGAMQDLGALGNRTTTIARGINDLGQVVGESYSAT